MTNSITPPPELVEQWYDACVLEGAITYDEYKFAAFAAQWGADQELEACIDVLSSQWEWDVLSQCTGWKDFRDQSEKILRAARRPKPMSRKERALEDLARIEATCGHLTWPETQLQSKRAATIRFALEALDD